MVKKIQKNSKTKQYELHRTLPATPRQQPVTKVRRTEVDKLNLKLNQPAVEKRRFWTWKKAVLIFLIVILTPFLVIGIWDYKNFAHASNKVFGSSSLFSLLASDQLKTDSKGRTNVLVVGYSADDPGHGGANLTDSIMVLRMDKSKKSGSMISIPRDLYVDIPNYGHAKINEAYQAGLQKTDTDEGGIKVLKQVLFENLGLDVQYYAIVDYGSVKGIVDALNGIDVNVQSPDPRGLYDPNFKPEEGGPLKLSNGQQHIDGQTALRLTRARGSTYGSYGFPQSDFNRTKNQQQVLTAIKSEVDWRLVLDPRINSKIFDAVAENIKTDTSLGEVLPLFKLFQSIPPDQLKNVTLNDINGVNLLKGHTTPLGQSALIPSDGVDNFDKIKQSLDSL